MTKALIDDPEDDSWDGSWNGEEDAPINLKRAYRGQSDHAATPFAVRLAEMERLFIHRGGIDRKNRSKHLYPVFCTVWKIETGKGAKDTQWKEAAMQTVIEFNQRFCKPPLSSANLEKLFTQPVSKLKAETLHERLSVTEEETCVLGLYAIASLHDRQTEKQKRTLKRLETARKETVERRDQKTQEIFGLFDTGQSVADIMNKTGLGRRQVFNWKKKWSDRHDQEKGETV